jgi:hypothetical protein
MVSIFTSSRTTTPRTSQRWCKIHRRSRRHNPDTRSSRRPSGPIT